MTSGPDAPRNPGSAGEHAAGAALNGVAPVAVRASPKRVVFDTNVLVSLYVFADSRFASLRSRIEEGRWLALTRDDCLAEFRRVLAYPQFGLDETARQKALAKYTGYAVRAGTRVAVQMPPLPRCKDRDDQKFLELARDGAAELLVTADKALLRLARRERMHGLFRILTPEAALGED